MDSKQYLEHITSSLEQAVEASKSCNDGRVADYIPELKNADDSIVSASILLNDGTLISSGMELEHQFTLQSTSKLVLLIGMIEEFGSDRVFSWINAEPSGQPFAAIGHLDRYGPVPSNPLINAGAICLSSRIPGDTDAQMSWVRDWMKKLFGTELPYSERVFQSELESGDRNRSLAYLMKSTKVLKREVEEVLIPYFSLCAYKVTIEQAVYLPMLLANGGLTPEGKRIISEKTSNEVISIMATCGLYNESGMHLVRTGLPAKSGVSGLVVAVATGRGGIAVYSPRLNKKGTSFRGQMILNDLARSLDWHFAAPWGYAKSNSKLNRDSMIYPTSGS